MKRRTFLKLAGMSSITFAAGCGADANKTLYSLVQAPDDMVTGQASWYASTCRECPAGCGILIKNREGRAIKIEGNPLHPINRGKLCMRGQAALQGIYHPDRMKTPLIKKDGNWQPISFVEAQHILNQKTKAAAARGRDRIRMLTEMVGDSLFALFGASMKTWQSAAPLVFEPLSYDAQKAANDYTFGLKGLPNIHIEKADCLVSFGADFLETWLSPVRYAREFKAMHALKAGKKGCYHYVGPYQSLTAANADQWISCYPGTEHYLALGIVHEMLKRGRGKGLPPDFRNALQHRVADYNAANVTDATGIFSGPYETLLAGVLHATLPVFLGNSAAAHGANALQINMAANLLNYIVDPSLGQYDFEKTHRVEVAAGKTELISFLDCLNSRSVEILLLNGVNPVYALPTGLGIQETLQRSDLFVICFSNMLDDTAQLADLVIPVRHAMESWDEYSGQKGLVSTLQPAIAPLTQAPQVGDLFLSATVQAGHPATSYKAHLMDRLSSDAEHKQMKATDWIDTFQRGGVFASKPASSDSQAAAARSIQTMLEPVFEMMQATPLTVPADKNMAGLVFIAAPSIRFYDGRDGRKPWLCEVPDPLTKVAWQTPVWIHPAALRQFGLENESVVKIESEWGTVEAVVYETEGVHPTVAVMAMGQGHQFPGHYADKGCVNPMSLISHEPVPQSVVLLSAVYPVSVSGTGRKKVLAHTDGSRIQHGRKIALSVPLFRLQEQLRTAISDRPHGLTMNDFPMALPLPEGYSPKRDIYPAHAHDSYRWAMVVDLDRCIGCNACAVACYAENNVGVVGEERIKEGREMSWLRVERYLDPERPERITFLPMMCQHCDNAPCESVCPVYAPHHSKEGINNQIYNRCIGTRFCSQNCPYKVRRFNWFDWQWPEPLPQQLNPNVTVRAKGVMEKCSFCVQRIKAAHGQAKNEARMIRDGEVVPACVQTCPTDALVFGNLMDPKSRVRTLAEDIRAYQVMGYLNTKPAVIYLQKVLPI